MTKDIRRYIRYTILGLRCCGLYHEKKFSEAKLYWIYSALLNGLFIGGLNISLVLYVVFSYSGAEDAASPNIFLTITFVMPTVKACFYLKNLGVVLKLIEVLDDEDFQPKNLRQQRKCEGFFILPNIIQVMYIGVGVSIMPSYSLMPLVMGKSRRLPQPAWYPYDWSEPIYYEISYVHQVVGMVGVAFVNTYMDMIIYSFLSYVAMECELLSDVLENIYDFSRRRILEDNDGREYRAVEEAEVQLEMEVVLVSWHRHHKKVIRFAEDVNSMFNTLLFVQFGSTLFTLCFTMYQLTMVKSAFELIVDCIFQAAIFVEILFYCHFGQQVITRSNRLVHSLYGTPWTDSTRNFKRNLLFFIRRCQDPIRIRALNIFELALPTCASIYRISWSFFGLLHQRKFQDN